MCAKEGSSGDQLGEAREASKCKLCMSRSALVDIMATQRYDDELASQGARSDALGRHDWVCQTSKTRRCGEQVREGALASVRHQGAGYGKGSPGFLRLWARLATTRGGGSIKGTNAGSEVHSPRSMKHKQKKGLTMGGGEVKMTVRNGYMYGRGGQWAGRASSEHEVRQGMAGRPRKEGDSNSRDPWL